MVIQAQVKVLQKGQIVIPAQIRNKLKIKPGSKLKLIFDGEKIILFKIEDPIEELTKLGEKVRISKEEIKEQRKIE